MSSHYNEDYRLFDDVDFELDFFSDDNDLTDCYLRETELNQFLAPSSEKWKDFLRGEHEAVVTIDSARDIQWKLTKEEIQHVKKTLKTLISVEGSNDPTLRQIINFILGPNSKIGRFFQDELELDPKSYLEFLSTYCNQAAYRVSFIQLFHETSLLKDHIKMSETDYIGVWKKIA